MERRNNSDLRSELRARDAEGFSRDWPVAPSYVVRDGVLRPLEDGVARLYAPIVFPQMATDFAKLRTGDEEGLTRFAENWGLLGYWELSWKSGSKPEGVAEPISWIWRHAEGVRLCLELFGYVQREDKQRLEERLESLRDVYDGADGEAQNVGLRRLPGIVVTYFAGLVGRRDQVLFRASDPFAKALHIISTIVNANVGGVGHQLHAKPSDPTGHDSPTLTFGHRHTACIELVYWHVARIVAHEERLRTCEECGEPFLQTDRRQRFCPPDVWATRSGSRCAKRNRMRRLRRKARPTDASHQ